MLCYNILIIMNNPERGAFFEGGEPIDSKKTENIDIPEKELKTLELISQIVGGDFGMSVKIGNPGEGSFFDRERNSVTLDPSQIKENPDMAKFVVGHEGSHRAISPPLKEIGLNSEQIKELYSQVGFGYLQNVIEDPAVNDWMQEKFPGFEPLVKEIYSKRLEEENTVLSTPEVQKIVLKLGYFPKFSQYGSELIRDWHQGGFSKNLDKDVEQALQNTIKEARKSRTTIPHSKWGDKKEIIKTAQERFRINTENIWPEMKKLVEMDLYTEEKRQMLNDFKQKQKELNQKKQELEREKDSGDTQSEKKLKKEIEKLEEENKPFDNMSKEAKEDLKEQVEKKKQKNRQTERLNKELEKIQKQLSETGNEKEKLEKEIEDLKEKAEKNEDKQEKKEIEKQIEQKRDKASGRGKKQEELKKKKEEIEDSLKSSGKEKQQESEEELKKDIKEAEKQLSDSEKKQEKLEKEIKNLEKEVTDVKGPKKKDLEKKIEKKKKEASEQKEEQKDLKDRIEQLKESLESQEGPDQSKPESDPFPEQELSQKTREEIEKAFRGLSKEKREELKEMARKELEKFEDEINKELQGKLNEDNPESHQERNEKREYAERSFDNFKRQERERERIERQLEKLRKEGRTEYDEAYEEVADIINALYNRLKSFFIPERHPKWRKGYPTGQRIDLDKAMQAEADIKNLDKLWERKTIPRKFDYRFSILVDLSGSMNDDRKIEETFKGVVVLAEVLEKLGIQYRISGFNEGSAVFKEWKDKLDAKKRDNLATMKNSAYGDTFTGQATRKTFDDFLENLGKDNFLITMTDGRARNPESLDRELERIKKDGRVKLVGIGLGPNTEFVKRYYKAAFSIPKMKITESERAQGEKDFAESFADILEDMIRHPDNY